MPDGFVKAAHVEDVPPGRMKLVVLEGERILLAHYGGRFYAVHEECTHAFGALSMPLRGDEVECPAHGALFNIRTGEALTPPAHEGLTVYSVRVEGSDVLVGPPIGDS